MIAIHRLMKQELQPIFALSNTIFATDDPTPYTYQDSNEWRAVLDDGGILLGAYADQELGGFLFARRTDASSYHIWLTGVSHGMRQRGIGRAMFREMDRIAGSADIHTVTIHTYPDLFPMMYQALPRFGFTLEREAPEITNGTPRTKSYFRKQY